jgi:hypothetical protein
MRNQKNEKEKLGNVIIVTLKLNGDNGLKELKTEHQAVIKCINYLADSANIKGVAFNKLCNGLTGKSFEMPNASHTLTVPTISKNAPNNLSFMNYLNA